jgi:hypothetical protein
MTTCRLTDAQIWQRLQAIERETGWPPAAVIDAVAIDGGLNADHVRAVYVAMTTMQGAG